MFRFLGKGKLNVSSRSESWITVDYCGTVPELLTLLVFYHRWVHNGSRTTNFAGILSQVRCWYFMDIFLYSKEWFTEIVMIRLVCYKFESKFGISQSNLIILDWQRLTRSCTDCLTRVPGGGMHWVALFSAFLWT